VASLRITLIQLVPLINKNRAIACVHLKRLH